MKRLFIAIKIEPSLEFKILFSRLKDLLVNERIKWVDLSNFHLTLSFLGDTEEQRIESLTLMLREICSVTGRFEFTVKGSGIFKNFSDPRVLWLGIQHPEELKILAERIKNGLSERGFATEERYFMPHLTLGRLRSVKNIDNLKKVIGKYRETEIQTVDVSSVILYESILLQTGAVYKILCRFELSSAD